MSKEIPIAEYDPPNNRELQDKALKFIKENKPEEYRKMKQDGLLKEYCRASAAAAERYAKNLMLNGMAAELAWNIAIRQEILESEGD